MEAEEHTHTPATTKMTTTELAASSVPSTPSTATSAYQAQTIRRNPSKSENNALNAPVNSRAVVLANMEPPSKDLPLLRQAGAPGKL